MISEKDIKEVSDNLLKISAMVHKTSRACKNDKVTEFALDLLFSVAAYYAKVINCKTNEDLIEIMNYSDDFKTKSVNFNKLINSIKQY